MSRVHEGAHGPGCPWCRLHGKGQASTSHAHTIYENAVSIVQKGAFLAGKGRRWRCAHAAFPSAPREHAYTKLMSITTQCTHTSASTVTRAVQRSSAHGKDARSRRPGRCSGNAAVQPLRSNQLSRYTHSF